MPPNTPFQMARYWQHSEKFTGLNGTWLGYVNELIKEIKFQLENTKEGTMIYKVRERAMKLLQLIYNLRIQDRDQFAKNKRLEQYVEILKRKPLIKKRPNIPSRDSVSSNELNTDIEAEKDDEPGEHWIHEKPFRMVAEYLQNIIESSTEGPAQDVTKSRV